MVPRRSLQCRSVVDRVQIINADGDVAKTLTLADLRRYPKHSVVVTLQCAGNRRSEMHAEREVKGLQWANAAVSTATWSGARLSDVLRDIGAVPGPEARHVQFVGLDCDMTGVLPLRWHVPTRDAAHAALLQRMAVILQQRPTPHHVCAHQ